MTYVDSWVQTRDATWSKPSCHETTRIGIPLMRSKALMTIGMTLQILLLKIIVDRIHWRGIIVSSHGRRHNIWTSNAMQEVQIEGGECHNPDTVWRTPQGLMCSCKRDRMMTTVHVLSMTRDCENREGRFSFNVSVKRYFNFTFLPRAYT